MQTLTPDQNAKLEDWWQLARKRLPKELRRSFNSAVLLSTWNMWKEHNPRTFNEVSKTPLQLFHLIVDEVDVWITAGFTGLLSFVATHAN
jgi:hypothetical protein